MVTWIIVDLGLMGGCRAECFENSDLLLILSEQKQRK